MAIVFVPSRGMSLKTFEVEALVNKWTNEGCFRPLAGNEFKNK